MNKKKHFVQNALILGTIGVGIYMLYNHGWGTAPSVSGLGFLFAGLAMWVPHCPVMRAVLK